MQTKSLSPICLLPEITLKLKIFFNSSINAQGGGEHKKEYATMPSTMGLFSYVKALKQTKTKSKAN